MLHSLTLRAALACAALSFALAPQSFAAPQGGSREDASVLAEILEGISGDLELESMPRSVDLRPLMPEIGMQTMNDCAAWAFGYYGRTYLEARNQGWKPDMPRLTFSPSFIYNQVNGGKDEGSNPFTVLELLRDRGAATLATFPYAAGDFRVQPPDLAKTEAPAFRIEEFEMVLGGKQMRELLARGEMVVLGVRTNPVFSGGRYSVYTEEKHAEGSAQRTDGQPHGYHAMAVGGYDDDRQAFLILNSWGSDWGQDGAVWVHYDVAEDFNLNQSTENLIDYGLVMRDRQSLVQWEGDHWDPVDTSDLRATVRPRFEGLDGNGQRRFRLDLDLAGRGSAIRSISAIDWELIVDGEVRGTAISNLGSIYPTYSNLMTAESAGMLRANLRLKDDSKIVLETPYEVDLTVLRDVRLGRRDAYYGRRLDDDSDAWRSTLMPKMSARDWRDLARIEWFELKDGKARKADTYEHDGSSDPAIDEDSKSQWTEVVATPQEGYAMLVFADGGMQRIAFPEEPFESPVIEAPTLRVTHRTEGEFMGQDWFHFDAQLLVPESIAPLLDDVRFSLDGVRLDGGSILQEGEPTLWPAPVAKAVSGYTSSDMQVSARLRLKVDFNVDPEFVNLDDYFTSANGGYVTYSSRSVKRLAVDLGSPEVELLWSDRYVGEVDGVPTWEVTQHLRDRSGRSRSLPEYTWPAGVERLRIHKSPDSFEVGEVLRVNGPYEVSILREDYEVDAEEQGFVGGAVTHNLSVAPRTPRTDAVFADVVRGVADRLDPVPGLAEVPMVDIGVRGPLQRLETVVELDAYVPSLAGGWLRASAQRADVLPGGSDTLLRARVPAPAEGEPVRVRVHWSDGASALLEAKPRGYTPYPISADLVLDAVERAWSIEANGLPVWVVRVALTGKSTSLEQVESMRLWATDEAGARREVELDEDGTAEVLTSVPLRFDATLEFAASTGLAERGLSAYSTLQSEHTATPLELFARLRDQDIVEIDPNAWDINEGASEPTMYAFVGLRGWERELRRIESITYHETDREARAYIEDYEPQSFEVTDRKALPGAAFAHPFQFVTANLEYAADVRLSGETEALALAQAEIVDDEFYRPDPGVTSRFERYGTDAEGNPTWLLLCDAGLSHTARQPNHLLYYLGPGGRPLPPAPEDAPTGAWGVGLLEGNKRPFLTSQAHPGFPAESVVSAAVNVNSADRFAFEAHHWNEVPALFKRRVKCPNDRQGALPDEVGSDTLGLVVEPFREGARQSLQRLKITGPLALTAQVATVRYTAQTAAGEVTLEPFAVEGFGHERFDARWLGAAPLAVRAELLDDQGAVLREISWKRGE